VQRVSGGHFLNHCLSAILMALAMVVPASAIAAERVAICYSSMSATLVALARLQGFYADEGVDADLKPYKSGFVTLEDMLAGKCNLATSTAVPVVHQSLRTPDFRVVASIASTVNMDRIIVRSDRGIQGTADLRGRSVAVPEFTSSHFLLDTTLVANGVDPAQVSRVYLPAQDVAAAFRRGDVDAAALWEPATFRDLAAKFGNRAKVLISAGLGTTPFLLVGRLDYVTREQATLEKVLRALLRAERFTREQPALAKAALARHFGFTPAELDYVWTLYDFRVSLDQPLLFDLERVARWRVGLLPPAEQRALPNYLDFIHLDALKAVRRQAVTIIH
jgi:NitT/TauT family transport system substrate-binding protein